MRANQVQPTLEAEMVSAATPVTGDASLGLPDLELGLDRGARVSELPAAR